MKKFRLTLLFLTLSIISLWSEEIVNCSTGDSLHANANNSVNSLDPLVYDDVDLISVRQEEKTERTDGCELLIITHPYFIDAANTLAAWKIRRGIYTQVVNTATIGNTSSQIESYIDYAYNNWTPPPEYLLILGDVDFVPTCYVTPHPSPDQGNIPGDFYYAECEDPTDYVPNMAYGRLSVDTAVEANNLVARIIKYERDPPTDPDYYTNILNVAMFQDGENLDPPPDELPDTIANRRFCKTSEDVLNFMDSLGYTSQRVYVTENPVNGSTIFPTYWNDLSQVKHKYIFENDDPPAGGLEIPGYLQKPTFAWDGDAADITSAFNEGRFFALYSGHGNKNGWSGEIDFRNTDVDALTNGEFCPIIWSIACHTGWFDQETDVFGGTNDECFAEHWLRHSTGGCCGIIASSRRSCSGYNDRLVWGMMDAIWPDFLNWAAEDPYGGSDPIYRMGDVLNYGKEYMFVRCDTMGTMNDDIVELYNLFGDPTTEIWTAEPMEIESAEVTTPVDIGTTSITVQVYPAIEDMLVAICTENSDNIFGTAYTNASGISTVALNHAITMEGPVFITITKHNYKPYEFGTRWATWEGDNTPFWNDRKNWDINFIPDSQTDIIIPDGAPIYPVIALLDAECKNITVESGATMLISQQNLIVAEDMTIHGILEMNQNLSKLYVNGSIIWESGSSANIIDPSAEMWIKGVWEFKEGSNVHLDNGYVEFDGSTNGFIVTRSDDSYFNHLRSDKNAGVSLYHSGVSIEDLVINGNLYNYEDSKIKSETDHSIILRGSFNNYSGASIQLENGTFIFDGTTHDIFLNTGDYFHDLAISSSGNTSMNSDLALEGNLLIESGTLVTNDHNIRIEGNWNNAVRDDGFEEGTGRVIIWGGNYPQYCYSNENFYELELDKTLGGAFCIDGVDVTCEAYDWTAGEINVISGSFTANNLLDNGIRGVFYLNPSGEINLNDPGDWVDLNGELHISGGTMTVTGAVSYWPYSHEASIEMSGGILDFPSCGINLTTNHDLIANITGGTIRTARNFTGTRSDFNPIGGLIELYGASDADLSMGTGSNFYDVLINKNVDEIIEEDLKSKEKESISRDRSRAELTRTNTVTFTSDLDIDGSFIIDSGIVNTNGFDMNVAGDWANNVGDTGFIEGTQTVTFDGSNSADILTDETYYNLIVSKTYSSYDGIELTNDIEVQVLADLNISDGTLEMNDNANLIIVNNVHINLDAGLNAGGFDTGLNLLVGGNWINDNIDYDTISGYTPGGETITFNGSTDQFITTQSPQEDFGHLVIDKPDGEFRPNDNIRVIHDLDIVTGCWHDNVNMLTHYIEGNFNVTAGTAACWNSTSGNTVVFKGVYDQTIYNPSGYHYFHDIVIDKTPWLERDFYNSKGAEFTGPNQKDVFMSRDVVDSRNMTVTLNSDIDMQWGDGLLISEGILDLNGMILKTMGYVQINNGGTLIIDEGAVLQVSNGDQVAVNGGGILKVTGAPGNLATVSHRSTGNYNFTIFQGGMISAEYGLFEHMTDNGVYVGVAGIVDPLHSFNNCTFKNGYPGSGTLLYIDNYDDIVIEGANFPDATSTVYNVAKISEPPTGEGYITMVNATGIFAGETYEYDLHSRIDWVDLPEVIDISFEFVTANNALVLSWTYPSQADYFKIYRSTDPYDFSEADVFISNIESYTEPITGVKYFYRVTAVIEDNDNTRDSN